MQSATIFSGIRFQIHHQQFPGIMDPYRYCVFPCSCAYQHMLILPVEISAAELWKWMKLWGEQSIMPAKSYNPSMIMPAQDQIRPQSK